MESEYDHWLMNAIALLRMAAEILENEVDQNIPFLPLLKGSSVVHPVSSIEDCDKQYDLIRQGNILAAALAIAMRADMDVVEVNTNQLGNLVRYIADCMQK